MQIRSVSVGRRAVFKEGLFANEEVIASERSCLTSGRVLSLGRKKT